MKEAESIYTEIITKIDKTYQETKSEIEPNQKSQELVLSQYQRDISAKILQAESTVGDLSEFKGKPGDVKVFLKVQEIIADINKCTAHIQNLNQASMSFVSNLKIQEFLSSTDSLGSVSTTEAKLDVKITVSDIWFPSFSTQKVSGNVQNGQIVSSEVSLLETCQVREYNNCLLR